MNKLFLIEGNNEFLIQKEINEIIPNKEEVEIITFDLEESTINDVIETLDTFDMFLKQKVVIATNPPFFNNVDETFPIAKFLKYLQNPSDNVLIFVTEKINRRLKLVKDTLSYFKYIEIKEINPVSFVKEHINGYKMDNLAISFFLNQVGNNYHAIFQELEKLKSYTFDTKEITKQDIEIICKKNIENSVFDLVDAILKKEKEKTIELYNFFINNGTEVFQILILLSNQIRLIYNVKVLSHLRDSEIASILEVKEYPVKLARGKGLRYSKSELLNLLYHLGCIDEDIKSGKILPNISFLSFVLQM